MLLKDLRRSLSKEARPRTDARSVLKDGRPELQAPEAREPLLEFHVNCDATRTAPVSGRLVYLLTKVLRLPTSSGWKLSNASKRPRRAKEAGTCIIARPPADHRTLKLLTLPLGMLLILWMLDGHMPASPHAPLVAFVAVTRKGILDAAYRNPLHDSVVRAAVEKPGTLTLGHRPDQMLAKCSTRVMMPSHGQRRSCATGLERERTPAIVLGDAMHFSGAKISAVPEQSEHPLTVEMADSSCAE